MGEAFVYMYFVGAGTAAGVATIVLLSWKVFTKMNKKNSKQRKAAF